MAIYFSSDSLVLAVERLIAEHLDITRSRQDWMASRDILSIITSHEPTSLSSNVKTNYMALAAAMQHIGLEKRPFNNVNGYYGIKPK